MEDKVHRRFQPYKFLSDKLKETSSVSENNNNNNNNLPLHVCFWLSGWKPALHLQPPVGQVHFPSPWHRYDGVPPTSSAWLTQVPVACSMLVTSLPVGVEGNLAKFTVTSGQTM